MRKHRYVNDMSKVKPDEIVYLRMPKCSILSINVIDNPVAPDRAVVVVFDNGSVCSGTLDGRIFAADGQSFVFKENKIKEADKDRHLDALYGMCRCCDELVGDTFEGMKPSDIYAFFNSLSKEIEYD